MRGWREMKIVRFVDEMEIESGIEKRLGSKWIVEKKVEKRNDKI